MADLSPEPIAEAIERGDRTLHFACANGRENGPYDLDGFAIMREGARLIPPMGLRVDGQSIVATFASPLQAGDEVA
jgi:hypothetical protein